MGNQQAQLQVVAHRGASHDAPENTLAAFARARQLRADWFELDCFLSADDQVVVMHDPTLERTTDGEGDVQAHTLAQIKALDAGGWFGASFAGEKVPTLAESLTLAHDKKIGCVIELKPYGENGALQARILEDYQNVDCLSDDQLAQVAGLIRAEDPRTALLVDKVVADIRACDVWDQVIIQSFSPAVCALAMQMAPGIKVALLGGRSDEDPQAAGYLRWGGLLGVAGMNASEGTVTPDFLSVCRERGQSVFAWTVDDEVRMGQLAALGVDGIITNRPDLCRRATARN